MSLEDEIKKCVRKKGKRFFIDWGSIYDLNLITRRSSDTIWEHLAKLGIISQVQEGNFAIVGGHVYMNPSVALNRYYFTEEKYAKGYQKGFYGNAAFETHIVKCRSTS